MKFDIPGYGVATEDNAALTMRLESLVRHTGDRSEDLARDLTKIPVGGQAHATFRGSGQTETVIITRLE